MEVAQPGNLLYYYFKKLWVKYQANLGELYPSLPLHVSLFMGVVCCVYSVYVW